eukprot:PITA_28642
MDGFSGYNQINIRPQDHSKTTFIFPWGTLAYHKLHFGLKNAGVTFHRAMNYAFHDIKNIVEPYLDDLPAHSQKHTDHSRHLRAIFICCRHYKIRLNPHKCVFCVNSGHLLGFVVSKDGIRLDPCKVQAIIDLPPPSSLLQIQKHQGKANFLRRFIPNYTELAKGYTRLLKKDVPFIWDKVAQASFDALKKSLIQATLRYSKWIAILEEFYLEVKRSKSKKALVFTELLCDLTSSSNDATSEEAIVDENLFLISSSDLWYRDIIIYLQAQTYRSNTSCSKQRCIRYQAKDYVIVGDTLYRRVIDIVLRRCLNLEEAEKVLNDYHSGACGGHQSGYATAQKILRPGYFWPTMFKDCITAVRSCHACQIFDSKTRRPPTPL